MNETKLAVAAGGNIVSIFGTALSVTELQSIVSIICTIIGLLITIGTAVVIPLIKHIRDKKNSENHKEN